MTVLWISTKVVIANKRVFVFVRLLFRPLLAFLSRNCFLYIYFIYDLSPGCQNVDKDGKAGRYYKGSVAKTISGKKCQKWSEQKPHKHKYAFVGDHNFCRNPKNGHTGVWCYTTSRKKRWEICAVPKCKSGAAIGFENCDKGGSKF